MTDAPVAAILALGGRRRGRRLAVDRGAAGDERFAGPLVRADARLGDPRSRGRSERPGDRRAGPPERPLPRVRRPDRVRSRRARRRGARRGSGEPGRPERRGRARPRRGHRDRRRARRVRTSPASRPPSSPDGGWPGGDAAAAARIEPSATGAGPLALQSLPDFKSADAMRFPLVRRGADAPSVVRHAGRRDPPAHVVLCDALFEAAIGAPCGGPAEDAAVGRRSASASSTSGEAAPDRWVSVYLPR